MEQSEEPPPSATTPAAAPVTAAKAPRRRAAAAPGVLLDQAPGVAPVAEAYNGRCNVPVCQQFYQSFRISDCTYQPYGGGDRRFCER